MKLADLLGPESKKALLKAKVSGVPDKPGPPTGTAEATASFMDVISRYMVHDEIDLTMDPASIPTIPYDIEKDISIYIDKVMMSKMQESMNALFITPTGRIRRNDSFKIPIEMSMGPEWKTKPEPKRIIYDEILSFDYAKHERRILAHALCHLHESTFEKVLSLLKQGYTEVKPGIYRKP